MDALSSKSTVKREAAASSSDMPALPRGKSTIMGGQIRSVDAVRDQLTLQVYGQKPLKILYDERTQIFRNGTRIPLHDLGPAEHASVQTTLDGAKIFAVSVHILTSSPEGDYQGRVASFDPQTGVLALTGGTNQEFRLAVTKDTTIQRQGPEGFTSQNRGQSDLLPGALVTVKFQPGGKGQGVAKDIAVYAVPGASFVFSGTVTALDVHAGSLTLTDPRDEKSYEIYFNAQDPGAMKMRTGDKMRISANYDGTRYVATGLSSQ